MLVKLVGFKLYTKCFVSMAAFIFIRRPNLEDKKWKTSPAGMNRWCFY